MNPTTPTAGNPAETVKALMAELHKPVKVPNLFLIGIPVFEGGPLYRIPVRLRYRLAGGRVTWIVRRYRPEAVFKDAFDEALARIGEATGLPVLRGAPEA
jgi:hypothetical protein